MMVRMLNISGPYCPLKGVRMDRKLRLLRAKTARPMMAAEPSSLQVEPSTGILAYSLRTR